MEKSRCEWAFAGNDPLYLQYHDKEWGVPLHDDNKLFELLTLEGAHAGLSWLTILRKRENYRKAFDEFDPDMVAKYKKQKIKELLSNQGIIRNRLKILSTIQNARSFILAKKEFGTFDKYIWKFAPDGRPKKNQWKSLGEIPSTTRGSDAMSKDLAGRGFNFVGSTICYSFMQATGMVNDHKVSCFRYNQV